MIKAALLVGAYLGAAVAANLAVGAWGQRALLYTAFLLIPFDLVARDELHERWSGRGLAWKMAALVAAGSLLSYAASPAAARVALASALSFAVAGAADALSYHLLRGWPRSSRMNLSNVCAAAVDSLAFPLIAFGSTTWTLSSGQAGTKIAGGYLWTLLFLAAARWRQEDDEREFHQRLEANLRHTGLLRRPRPAPGRVPLRDRRPIAVKGKPVSETIIEDRR